MARRITRLYQLAGSVYYSGRFSLGGAFEQEGSEGGGPGAFQYVRGNYKPSKGTNLTVARRFPLYHPRLSCLLL